MMGKMPPLISPNEMRNPLALGNALNKMYEDLLAAFSRHTVDTNAKFDEISRDIASIRENSGEMSERLKWSTDQIEALREKKADIASLHKVAAETKSFKDEMIKRAGEQDEKIAQLEKRMQGMSNAIEGNRCGTAFVRNELLSMGEVFKLENERIRSTTKLQDERINVLEIKQSRLHLTIDGVPEDANVNPALLIVTKFNNDTDAELTVNDFKSAWRVGTYIPDKPNTNHGGENIAEGVEGAEAGTKDKLVEKVRRKPRTIAVILALEGARDKIMSNRSKLTKYDDGTYMWINEEQPEAYRRRKMMLRDLVKLAKKKGFKDAKVENGGIKAGGVLYTPDRFCDLPDVIKPKQVRTRRTKNKGIAFCSEWTGLSNMAYAPFQFKGAFYSSAEQCFQAEKAKYHNKMSCVRRIVRSEDPYKCKKIGSEVEISNDWMGVREEIMKDIVYHKFSQNEDMKGELIATGNASLYEAVTGSTIWSTHSSIHSKATYEETATGPNVLGKILEKVRESLSSISTSQQTG